MTKPLLHLLHHEPLDPAARVTVIEELIAPRPKRALIGNTDDGWLRRIMITTSAGTGTQLKALLNTLTRYPELAALQIGIHRTEPHDAPPAHAHPVSYRPRHASIERAPLKLKLAEADLLVGLGTATQHAAREAMAADVPVLVADLSDATFVLDGITGFLYRANDPDSLALSLLTLRNLPVEIVQHIARRAGNTLAALAGPYCATTPRAKGEML